MTDYNPYEDPNYYRVEYRAASGARATYVAHLLGPTLHRVTRTAAVNGAWCVPALPDQIHDFTSRAEAEAFAARQADAE